MSTATAPKLCVNCVHYRHEDTHYDRHRCTHPSHGVDLVTGAAITPKCGDQRRHESSRCGPAGYLFNRRDPIPSQPLQPGAVSLPVGGAGSGHTAIVVEEYFLGAGVALVGQSGDLGRSERAFELEAPGGRLVFDPDRAHLAEWLVPTVQGDVAPVGDTPALIELVFELRAQSERQLSQGLLDVATERQRQDAKWGGPEHDDGHHAGDWHRFVNLRLARVPVLASNGNTAEVRQMWIQIAALAVAAAESIDRKGTP